MSFWYDRLREMQEKNKLSNYKLAEALETDTSTISRYISGRGAKTLTRNLKRKLYDIFSAEEVGYIENGRVQGPQMAKSGTDKNKIFEDDVAYDLEDQIAIPYHKDVYASAGGGSDTVDVSNTSPISFSRAFLNSFLGIHNVNGLSIINAAGNSMEPTIKSGEMMFVYPTDSEDFKDGGIYVLMCSDKLLVKRVTFNPLTKEYTLVSDNGAVAPVTMTIEEGNDCHFVGRVVGHFDRV